MNDPLDELIRTLRSPASREELEGMSVAVDAMHDAVVHAAHLDTEPRMTPTADTDPSSSPPRSRPRRFQVATFVAAGVLGFAGVAAAGPGSFFTDDAPDVPETTDSTSTTTPDDELDPETTAATVLAAPAEGTGDAEDIDDADDADVESLDPESSTSLVDDPDTAFDETQCAEGNHGQTVSSVAKAAEPGPGHGAEVREAAQSSCGKDQTDDTSGDGDDDTAGDESTSTSEPAASGATEQGPGNGNGNAGSGNGNGAGNNGNGNGNNGNGAGGNGQGNGKGKP